MTAVRARDLVAVELRKLVDTPAMLGLLTAGAVLAGITGGGAVLQPGQTTFGEVARMSLLFAPYLLVILAALLVTSERVHGTDATTAVLVPARGRTAAAKAVAVAVLAGVAAVLGPLAALVITPVGAAVSGKKVAADVDWGTHAVHSAGLLTSALIGWALALATGSAVLTIVAFYLWPMVSRLLTAFSGETATVVAWLQPDTVYLLGPDADSRTLAQTLVGLACWLVLPAAVGLWRTHRRDIP